MSPISSKMWINLQLFFLCWWVVPVSSVNFFWCAEKNTSLIQLLHCYSVVIWTLPLLGTDTWDFSASQGKACLQTINFQLSCWLCIWINILTPLINIRIERLHHLIWGRTYGFNVGENSWKFINIFNVGEIQCRGNFQVSIRKIHEHSGWDDTTLREETTFSKHISFYRTGIYSSQEDWGVTIILAT